MAWPAAKGIEVAIRHAVRDPGGTLKTGQAGAIATALSTPAGVSSGITRTVSEIGATGYYLIKQTLDAAGAWALMVTDPAPPNGSGQDFEYPIACADVGLVGAPLAGYGLTDLATVRLYLKFKASETKWDPLIQELIEGVTNDLEIRAGRHFGLYSYVERLDGWGIDTLWLSQGPLVSITEVAELRYTGSGESATVTPAAAYVGYGTGDGTGSRDVPGRVWRTDGGVWTPGRKNWRVTYTAGHAVLPPALTMDATRMVVAHFRGADLEGLITQGALDLSTTPIGPAELDRLAQRIAWKWALSTGAI